MLFNKTGTLMLEKCHFIGIGGIGMSGLAQLLLNEKSLVSGSDISSNFVTESLNKNGATVYLGHAANQVPKEATVIYSTDIKKDNPEYLEALKLKCPLWHRSELLQYFMAKSFGIAIAGTHGKTTTSSLLTWVLESSGESPSFAIGGIVPQLTSNAGKGKGKYFVAEACESDGSFLNYKPKGGIVTNIDLDHMDYYKNEPALIESFKTFMEQIENSSNLFFCGEDRFLSAINPQGVSYGFGAEFQLQGSNFSQKEWSISFDATFKGIEYKNIKVSLTGKHNALNALAVFGLCLSLGIKEALIRKGLNSFGGVLRRCEKKGSVNNVLFLDDYAHHPTELKATLKAIRTAIGERRLVAVYQPHRYSRSQDCMGLYSEVFNLVDTLFVTEIYAAGEKCIPSITHEKIAEEIQIDLKDRCRIASRKEVSAYLTHYLRPHDVLVTLGAGDVTKISQEILNLLSLKPIKKLKLGLISGGQSVEHDISLISSSNVFSAMNKDLYEIEQFFISREGNWSKGDLSKNTVMDSKDKEITKLSPDILTTLLECDILFPVLHGTYGEDGTIQGFFDILGKPYVGCDHRSSAICMDKVLSKRLVLEANLPTASFVSFTAHEWEQESSNIVQKIKEKLTFPLFVKAIHLGSSIGVYKVNNDEALMKGIKEAFSFDNQVIVETGLENIKEIEFSVFGNDQITVFPAGEVFTNGLLHDYDSKYGLNKEKPAAKFNARASITSKEQEEGMNLAKAVYKTLGCVGMARIDTFMDQRGKFWFNEVNPIPGFTNSSLYPLICEFNGLPLSDLIDKLLILGLQRKRFSDRTTCLKK